MVRFFVSLKNDTIGFLTLTALEQFFFNFSHNCFLLKLALTLTAFISFHQHAKNCNKFFHHTAYISTILPGVRVRLFFWLYQCYGQVCQWFRKSVETNKIREANKRWIIKRQSVEIRDANKLWVIKRHKLFGRLYDFKQHENIEARLP